jgi:hypothetical protein
MLYDVIPLFSTPVFTYKEYENTDQSELINFIKAQPTKKLSGGNYGVVDTYILENSELSQLKDKIWKAVEVYVSEIMHWEEYKFEITQSWVNINPKGSFHGMHYHANSIISGVYYVKTNGCGTISFSADSNHFITGKMMSLDSSSFNLFNSARWSLPVQDGSLVLFPSSLAHFVPTNEHEEDRISLAFNIFVRGKIGSYSHLTELAV